MTDLFSDPFYLTEREKLQRLGTLLTLAAKVEACLSAETKATLDAACTRATGVHLLQLLSAADRAASETADHLPAE